MAFFFVCGNHTFQSLLKGYENITVQCQNCGNWSGKIIKRWEWIHLCFIPLIPLSFKPWHAVHCDICNFNQDIKYRPDVQQRMDNPEAPGGGAGAGAAGGAPGGQQQIPMQNPGWGSQQPSSQQRPQYEPQQQYK